MHRVPILYQNWIEAEFAAPLLNPQRHPPPQPRRADRRDRRLHPLAQRPNRTRSTSPPAHPSVPGPVTRPKLPDTPLASRRLWGVDSLVAGPLSPSHLAGRPRRQRGPDRTGEQPVAEGHRSSPEKGKSAPVQQQAQCRMFQEGVGDFGSTAPHTLSAWQATTACNGRG